MTVDMTKVTPDWVADNAAGTMQQWFEGYTDHDDDIGGQVKVSWWSDMQPNAKGVYVGEVAVTDYRTGEEKRFRLLLRAIPA